jgi:hypothetical protein
MTQNRIAPMTTIIRIPITSVSTAISVILALSPYVYHRPRLLKSLRPDQKQDGADGGSDNGRRDPGAEGWMRNWGSNQLPIKAPIKMSATRPKRGVH